MLICGSPNETHMCTLLFLFCNFTCFYSCLYLFVLVSTLFLLVNYFAFVKCNSSVKPSVISNSLICMYLLQCIRKEKHWCGKLRGKNCVILNHFLNTYKHEVQKISESNCVHKVVKSADSLNKLPFIMSLQHSIALTETESIYHNINLLNSCDLII